jgi:hypothetical protein
MKRFASPSLLAAGSARSRSMNTAKRTGLASSGFDILYMEYSIHGMADGKPYRLPEQFSQLRLVAEHGLVGRDAAGF